ncbi:uncharacterized protein LOC107884753 [Acyrthosiphon pisum]|uniref:Reverse transcriptase domain-containing protein n=1 Tax=Acyrthosiphon pisum TaxID=7029 RepID=A0A8R2H8C8_ACYPI|nr:uncharacterized protein LOC107884753 [Acyrthosiphon pisum]|eukprot:XP_016663014.1 PREDICTED: uncharacterized protein LOC107884753 [Acyrthosiphon pisum]
MKKFFVSGVSEISDLLNELEREEEDLAEEGYMFRTKNCVDDWVLIKYKLEGKSAKSLHYVGIIKEVFDDVQKAFDSVNHKLLMFKLENAGIRGLPYNLIKSFLGDRTQRVKLNDTYSDILEVSCGVPQGTVLG